MIGDKSRKNEAFYHQNIFIHQVRNLRGLKNISKKKQINNISKESNSHVFFFVFRSHQKNSAKQRQDERTEMREDNRHAIFNSYIQSIS